MKKFAKTVVKTFFLVLILPVFLLYRLFASVANKDSVFHTASQYLSLIPGKLGVYLRAAFYRLACPGTSDEISIGFLTILSHQNTTIEKGVYIGPQCNIGKCHIKENTLLGSGVHVLSGNKQHSFEDTDRPIQEQGGTFQKISIGVDCWVGNNSVIMANVNDKCIVAAGSVVTKEADGSGLILAGNPARLLRSRHTDTIDDSSDT